MFTAKEKINEFPVIREAVFSDLNGNILSFKELPEYEKIRISGITEEKAIDVIARLVENVLISDEQCYTFVPKDSFELINAMELSLINFDVYGKSDPLLFLKGTKNESIQAAIEKMKEGTPIYACGRLNQKHYRTNGNGIIKTSIIKEIIQILDTVFLKTENSVYRVV